MAHISELVIAKFDATENEVEGLAPVNNFPQLRLFTKHDKQGILFDEKERTLPQLLDFLAQHSEAFRLVADRVIQSDL